MTVTECLLCGCITENDDEMCDSCYRKEQNHDEMCEYQEIAYKQWEESR